MPIADIILKSRVDSDRMYSFTRKAASTAAASGTRAFGDQLLASMSDGSSFGGMGGGNQSRGAKAQLDSFRSVVYAAVNAIATRAARQPVRVAKQADSLVPIPNHPLVQLINDPNPVLTRWSLMYSLAASIKLTGCGYLWITQGEEGKPHLYPLPPTWVEPKDQLRRVYKVRPAGRQEAIEVPGEQICYIPLPDPANPFQSFALTQALASAINADEAIQTAQINAFKNGSVPGMVVRVGKQPMGPGQTGDPQRPYLTDAQRRSIISAIRLRTQGVINNREPVILDALIDEVFPYAGMKNSEMDFMESSKLCRSRILTGYGVSELILGETENGNRAQVVAAEELFAANVINPLLQLISETVSQWVSPLFGSDLVVWWDEVRPHDKDMESREWSTAASRGYVTPNEFRNRLGLPPFDDEEADQLPALNATPAISHTAAAAAATIKQARMMDGRHGRINPY